ncbi:T9SS type A sorting domain-containing protein, partial [Fulvivirga sp. RKSG066]|uniref:T9SS type A sorting domain-containing protein n=1 Tax=Fulvivirga aurantia TaxID=2529383 RepID=UPI0012BB8551
SNLPKGEDILVEVNTVEGVAKYSDNHDINNRLELDLSDLKGGLYILKISYGDQVLARKILKSVGN